MPDDKRQLLAEAETEFQALKRAVAGLDETRMREVWCGSWSVREILGHISGWHREMLPALERLSRRKGDRATVFVISDFIQSGPETPFRDALMRLARGNDLVAIRLISGAQLDLLHDPPPGTIRFAWAPFQLYRGD